jgi:trimethylamine---corrinoid protein Co-methyltransferase
MILGEYWKLHDDATIRKIDTAAVRLLTRSGARIDHEGLLEMLEGAGCRTDRAARRCYFTERLVRDAIGHVGGKTTDDVHLPVGWSPQTRMSQGGSFPHLVEWPSGRRRLATRQDVIDMAQMAHSLPEFSGVGKVLATHEVHQRIEPLWHALQLAQITDKPIGGGEIFHADYIEPLVRMGEVLTGESGDTSLVAACDFFIAPLILDPNQAACFLEKRRFGIPNVPGTMPISGMSAPVTIAGTVAVAVAELMAGWVLGYVVNPDVPARGIVSSGSLDMRTTTVCFGSPEAMLQDVSVVNICRRLYGIPVHAAVGYTDCKRPGLEAAFLKMFALLGVPFGTDQWISGWGLLSAGQDYSPVQHMLDSEMEKSVERFRGHYEVNEETLAVELTEQMMRAGTTNFLDAEHTFRNYAAEQWYPRWLDRTPWQSDEYERGAEAKMLERIDRHCKDAIARYRPPDVDPAKVAELRRIFLAAEKQILGSNVTCL